MIQYIDLSDWKKMKDIKIELHREYGINISKDGREWRNEVKNGINVGELEKCHIILLILIQKAIKQLLTIMRLRLLETI